MKTLTLILVVLGAGTVAAFLGQEIDQMIPHTVTQCRSTSSSDGTTTTECVDISVHGHIG